MSKKSLLPRGFKAEAERISLRFREELGLKQFSPLSGFDLAEHLKIKIYTPAEFFSDGVDLSPLIGDAKKDRGWSALTMSTEKGNKIIIHNDLHASTRQESNIMHELAHSICKHERPKTYMDVKLPFFMRQYDPQQEQEANYLGGALQLPREALVWALKNRMSRAEIGEYFTASQSMVTFRINATGVMRQLSYLNRR